MLISTPPVILTPEKPPIIRQERPRLIRPDEPRIGFRANFLPFPLAMFGSGGGGVSTASIIDMGAEEDSGGFVTMPVTGNAPTRSTIVVLYATDNASFNASSVSDDNNTYTQIGSTISGTGFSLSMWYVFNAVALPSGGNITAFLGGSATFVVSVLAISGATATDSLDVSNTATGNSSIASVSATTISAKTFLVGAFASAQSSATGFTPVSGFSAPFSQATGTTDILVAGGNKKLSSAGSNTYNPTMGGSARWGAMLAAFKYN